MNNKRDDFAWILELRHQNRAGSSRQHPRGQSYETVEQIFERRTKRRNRWKAIIILLLEVALPLIVFLLLL